MHNLININLEYQSNQKLSANTLGGGREVKTGRGTGVVQAETEYKKRPRACKSTIGTEEIFIDIDIRIS